jgi:hypothetical protein
MARLALHFWLAAGSLLLGSAAWGADPPADENLPPPRVLEPAPEMMPVPLAGYYRTNRWDVWRYYEVDRQGVFRPLVVYSPYGSYYLYNGAPYPWMSNHQRDITPRILGTPYRMPYILD